MASFGAREGWSERKISWTRIHSRKSRSRGSAPIARPGKILCIGLNYRDHAIETNSPIPTEPVVFMKAT